MAALFQLHGFGIVDKASVRSSLLTTFVLDRVMKYHEILNAPSGNPVSLDGEDAESSDSDQSVDMDVNFDASWFETGETGDC
jgi:hypothetical protein